MTTTLPAGWRVIVNTPDAPSQDDLRLIGYCEIHCRTERALFIGRDINRMLALAGHPAGFARRVPPEAWFSVHDDMADLCRLARERMRK